MSGFSGISAGNTRGRPLEPSNPGRPKGARHKATLAAEALLDGDAEGLTRKCVEMALGGDSTALRLAMERIVPPRRERPVNFQIPALQSAEDAAVAMAPWPRWIRRSDSGDDLALAGPFYARFYYRALRHAQRRYGYRPRQVYLGAPWRRASEHGDRTRLAWLAYLGHHHA